MQDFHNIWFVCLFTTIIHFMSIIGLSARIVGVRTRKLATSSSLFNIITIIAQVSNAIQAPLLAKFIEKQINNNLQPSTILFRIIIAFATIGTFLGILAIPTAHRFMLRGVNSLYKNRSIFKVALNSFRIKTIFHFKDSLTLPKLANLTRLKNYKDIPLFIISLNCFVYCFITISVLACLYAGFYNPRFRITALSLNGISAGLGTLGLMLFIEPFNATMTDRVVEGTVSEAYFRRFLTFVVLARMCGTILGQFLFIPLAQMIIKIAEII
jgi:Alternate to MurJ